MMIKNQAFCALYQVLIDLVRIMAPFTPAFSETIFRGLRKDSHPESVHLLSFPKTLVHNDDRMLIKKMQNLRNMVEEGHALRSKLSLKLRQPLNLLEYSGSKIEVEMEEILKEELNVKKVNAVSKLTLKVENQSEDKKIALDSNITPELKMEGVAREIIRVVQRMRKKAQFKVDDRIELYYGTKCDIINKTLQHHMDIISKETLSVKIETNRNTKVEYEEEVDTEGSNVWMGIRRTNESGQTQRS